MPTVLLIRHGESMANKGLPSLNPEKVPLSVKGKKQAREIARSLKSQPLDLIVTSSYLRSKDTSILTRLALPHVRVEEWPVHEFTYLTTHLKFEKYGTVRGRKPLVETFWELSEPDFIDGPGAESFQQFFKRVWEVIERLERPKYKGKMIAIFTHEQFISAFRWLLERDSPNVHESDMREFRQYLLANRVANGQIVKLKVYAKMPVLANRELELVGSGTSS
jgi:broad specificity phosphatase PhoE